MPCQQRDGRERVVQQRGEEGVEPIGVGEGVGFRFVEVETRAPEFRVGAFDDDAAGFVGADGELDVAEGCDDGLGVGGIHAVFGFLVHRYDVDGWVRGGDCEVFEGWGSHCRVHLRCDEGQEEVNEDCFEQVDPRKRSSG